VPLDLEGQLLVNGYINFNYFSNAMEDAAMTNYIGLDAHSKTCTAVVIDGYGKFKQKQQFNTSEKNLLEFIRQIKGPRNLALEEMNLSHWLYVLLKPEVEKLVIAHPAHLGKHRGPKNDHQDALRLAEALRMGSLTHVYHEESALWKLRTVVQSYLDFTGDLVRTKNRYKALLLLPRNIS
jgi:hypothetical protein